MSSVTDVELRFEPGLKRRVAELIEAASGREVFFLAKVRWRVDGDQRIATVHAAEVMARGHETAVPAVIEDVGGWDLALHNHPSGNLEPSDPDLQVAASLRCHGVGFAIISSDASRHYLVTAPRFVAAEAVPIDLEEVQELFAASGALGSAFDDYESRSGQVDMARAVAAALNRDEVAALEAGTGVGKSFAYLVPAILWAVRNRQRVVISTGTIQLQEQLVTKDLPFLRRALPYQFAFALVKGRGQYACRRKIEELAASLDADLVQSTGESAEKWDAQFRSLIDWSARTADGSLADLNWSPHPDAWEQVMSESDKSLRSNCRHYGNCFFYSARRHASSAAILVVNHHLFFADLAVRRVADDFGADGVLPAYQRVIFDEAQHLEEVASEHLGLEFSPLGVRRRLSRMCSQSEANQGAIWRVIREVEAVDETTAVSLKSGLPVAVPSALQRIDAEFDELTLSALDVVEASAPPPAANEEGADDGGREGLETFAGETKLRYREGKERQLWRGVQTRLAAVQKELGVVLRTNQRAVQALSGSRLPESKSASLLLELTSFGSRLQALVEQMGTFCTLTDRNLARWLTLRQRRGDAIPSLRFGAAPIRVAGELRRNLFNRVETVVLTSATLSVAGRIQYFAERLGLDAIERERFVFRSFASPFDYQSQAITATPTDLPPPSSGSYEGALVEAVYAVVKASGGRAFILFTSYRLLRKTYDALAGPLRELGLDPMAQGESPRGQLVRRFVAEERGVLFGTDSFWEGVDVKGRALECVVITRLPFRVPTEPIQEARVEDLERRGIHPFRSFSLPQAVLKLKQGFGRLIRSTSDRGVVVILDQRIVSKSYGRLFLESLPEARVLRGDLAAVVSEIARFLGR